MDFTIVLHTAAVLSLNVAADPAPAVQISAGIERYGVTFELEARGVLPSVAYAREPADWRWGIFEPQDFDLSQWSLGVVACMRFATYFAGCSVLQGVLYILQTRAETALAPTGYGGPRLAVEIPFAEHVAAFGFADALFGGGDGYSFVGDRPNGDPWPNAHWRPPWVSGFFGAGVAASFQ